MINLKLKTIAEFIEEEDVVLDSCCDHAYLAIYLKKKGLAKEVYASDISKEALKSAQDNIQKAGLAIKLYLADGFKGIDNESINTLVIAGVGRRIVEKIVLSSPLNVKKIIISSNNYHEEIRRFMIKEGFSLTNEKVVLENEQYYPIMVFKKAVGSLSEEEYKYGISNDIGYYKYLLAKYEDIVFKIPAKYADKRLKYTSDIKELKAIIERIGDY